MNNKEYIEDLEVGAKLLIATVGISMVFLVLAVSLIIVLKFHLI